MRTISNEDQLRDNETTMFFLGDTQNGCMVECDVCGHIQEWIGGTDVDFECEQCHREFVCCSWHDW